MARDRSWEEVASGLADMARDLLDQASVQATLDAIVRHAVDVVFGCENAGILQVRKHLVHTLAGTSELAHASGQLQVQLGEGPCLDAARTRQRVFRINDMTATEQRWPRYASKARELGVGSMMGFLLYTTGTNNLGALNLYAGRPGAFDERSERVGLVLASHAAVALSSARQDASMHSALGSARVIGEAIGITMSHYRLDEDEAFHKIAAFSQNHNIKLRVLAEEILRKGAQATD